MLHPKEMLVLLMVSTVRPICNRLIVEAFVPYCGIRSLGNQVARLTPEQEAKDGANVAGPGRPLQPYLGQREVVDVAGSSRGKSRDACGIFQRRFVQSVEGVAAGRARIQVPHHRLDESVRLTRVQAIPISGLSSEPCLAGLPLMPLPCQIPRLLSQTVALVATLPSSGPPGHFLPERRREKEAAMGCRFLDRSPSLPAHGLSRSAAMTPRPWYAAVPVTILQQNFHKIWRTDQPPS